MKRAQMEIMGLMLIAIIAAVFILFGYYTVTNKTVERADNDFQEGALASRFVSTLEKTYVPECKVEYEKLVKDCVTENKISCGSCAYVDSVARKTLEKTLDAWMTNYRLKVDNNGVSILELKPDLGDDIDCTDNSPKEAPGTHLVPLYPFDGEAKIIFDVCK